MTRLVWSKRKSVAAVVICTILAVASVAFWQMNQSAQAAMVYPHPGLVGWWRFDEGSGTIAGDSSGNGNNGTINGATWVDGKYGKALSFDGINDVVEVPDSSSLHVTQISICAWVKLNNVGKYQQILQKWGADGYSGVWMLRVDSDNRVLMRVYIGGNIYYAFSSSPLSQGTWYFVVGTFDGSKLIVYLNAVTGTPTSVSGSLDTSTLKLQIGQRQSNDLWFDGIIDEVRIYNRALSAAEIQADFQKSPDFSSMLLAKVPKGTTQVITTLSWQGAGSLNATIISPSQNYTEDMIPVYQKTVYSTSGGTSNMLNIKRLSVSVNALASDQSWYVMLTYDNVDAYQAIVEVQK